jgi:hypothetical protein
MCVRTRLIEECGKRMHGQLPLRDDVIAAAVERGNMETTTSSDAVIHSTIELAQMTSSIRELSTLFRKMVEGHKTTPPCDNPCKFTEDIGENGV